MVGFSLMLKVTYIPAWGRWGICLICALLIGLSWESAANQSKTRIADWLHNPELMLDVAVLLTVDVFMQISFCILKAKKISGERLSKIGNILLSATLWIPGILIFPTLYALLVEVIFSAPGVDFGMLAWSLAAVVLIVGVILSFVIRSFIPEDDLRLELIFMINAMIALLGVVATVNGRTAVSGTDVVQWKALIGTIAILLIGSIAGFLLFKHNNNKYSNII